MVLPAAISTGGGYTVRRPSRGPSDDKVRMLIDMRMDARQAKDFNRSDQIRDQLAALGVMLEDGRGGTTYRLTKG